MLNRDDFLNVNRHIGSYIANIEGKGLRLRVDDDLSSFACARSQFSGYIHPALDPNHSNIGTGLWLEATAPDGSVVGCVAARKFQEESLANLIWSRQLWGDRRPLLRAIDPISLLWPEAMAAPSGRLVYSGVSMSATKPATMLA